MGFIPIKETPQFTADVTQWTRETDADGEQMAKEVIEPLLNNDIYLKEHLEELDGNVVKDGDKGVSGGVATLGENGKLVQHVEYNNVDNIPYTAWDDVTNKPRTYPPSSHTHNKSEVGLGNVDNTADTAKRVAYATNAGDADTLDGKHASSFALSSHSHSNYASSNHTHNYAGSASAGGSATSADKAAKLSTARTITIGSKGKNFDGSANVSWTLDEIGAFPNKRSGMSSQGQDFDSFTLPGFYEIGVDNGFDYAKTKHAPKINSWGFLLVFNSGWVCLQIYIPFKTHQYVDDNLKRYVPRSITYSGGGGGNYYSGVTVKECEGQYPSMAIRSKWGTSSTAAWTEWRYIWGSAWDGTGVFGKTE